MKKTILSLAACAASVCLSAAPLFEGGKSVWNVVIPVDATTENKYAAEEFTTAVKKISGVELPVVQADTVSGENHVIIGSLKNKGLIPAIADTIKLKNTDDVDDIIAVYTVKGNLYLAGNNPRSATYAVYHFLREYLGVRWFWPGPDGEFMPKKDKFEIPEIAYNYQAAFRYRALTPVCRHGDFMIEQALFRMYMNAGQQNGKLKAKTGAIRRVGTHSIGMNERDFEKYPERFALIDGKRQKYGVSGCWSNEDFTKAMIDNHVKQIQKTNAELLCAFPADVVQRCQCPGCTKLKNRSSRWYSYYGKLVNEIRKQCPGIRAAGIAYQEFSAIPDIPVEGLEYVEYCLSDRCYVHPLDDPDCVINKAAVNMLKEWQKKAPMGIYGYEYDVFTYKPMMYLPMQNQMGKSARFFRDMKMIRLKTEYPAARPNMKDRNTAFYIPIRLSSYVFCMTAWNPDLDVDALVKDYCKYVYGEASDAMYEYHTTMAKYWDSMEIHLTYFLQSSTSCALNLLNPERIKAMNTVLANAGKAAAAIKDEKERARVQYEIATEQKLFDTWAAVYNKYQGKAYKMKVEKRPAGTDFDTLPALPVTSKENDHPPTDIRMYYSEEGLHFRVINKKADLAHANYGEAEKDFHFWTATNVEFFLDFNDGKPYHQLGVCLAGGYYDAVGNDSKSWNPEWKRIIKIDKEKDEWSLEVFLPFSDFGGVVPKPGKQWKINIIRNRSGNNKTTCGFPAPVYRDLDMGAYITF